MPFDGSGNYNLPGPALVDGQTVSATEHNSFRNDIAAAMDIVVTRDGQAPATSNLPMGGFKHTNVADGTALTEYATVKQLQTRATNYLTSVSGNNTITGLASPSPTSYQTGQEFTFLSVGANTGPVTLNVSSLGAISIKKAGNVNLIANDIPANAIVKVIYDGTNFELATIYVSDGSITTAKFDASAKSPLAGVADSALSATSAAATQSQLDNSLKAASTAYVDRINVPVRQTVLSGPVDSSGLSAFGGSTGSTTVTMSGTLIATASSGADNRRGSVTNASWTGLSTNGTMYLYLDIVADGSCTTGSTALLPTYQWGGTYSTTNNQHTFNIQEMQMRVGNGTTASQVWRVFVGQVTVSGGVVTAITWYALMGRYVSAWVSISAAATVNFSHNIGLSPLQYIAKGATSSAGAGESDFMLSNSTPATGGAWCLMPTSTSISVQADPSVVRIAQTSSPYFTTATHCRVVVNRGW